MVPATSILPLGVVLFRDRRLHRKLGLLVVGEVLELQFFRFLGGFALELVGAGDAGHPNLFFAPGQARRAPGPPGRWRRSRRPAGRLGSRLLCLGPARRGTRRRGSPGPFRSGRFLPGRRTALRRRSSLRGGFAFGARRPLARRRPRTRPLPACRFLLPGRRPGGLSSPSAPPFFRFHCHVFTSLSTNVRPRRIIQFRVCRGEPGTEGKAVGNRAS
jgi:hypothetical protein